MAITRGNILSGGKDIYLGKSGTSPSPLASGSYSGYDGGTSKFIFIGAAKEGSIKLNGNPFEEVLHDGTGQQVGMELKFEVEGLESNPAVISAVEAFLNEECQILLFPAGTAPANNGTATKIDKVGISVGFNGVFTRKNANSFKLTAQRHADKFSTAVTTITLTS